MNELEGSYFDGGSSRKRAALLRWGSGALALLPEDGGRIGIDLQQLRLTSPLAGAPTRLNWGGEDSFVTLDHEGVAAMRRDLNLDTGWLSRIESRLSAALAAGVLCIALIAAFVFWGVPTIAARTAFYLPAEVSDQLGDLLLEELGSWLPPSKLPAARRQELARYFTSHGAADDSLRVEFRASEVIGANALTLSATTVALTDELVKLADNDEELLAVYFHELGHAKLRHVEQKVLTASAWLVTFGLLTGDIGVVGDVLLSGVLLGPALSPYSRALEREADAYAVDRLLEAGLSPQSMISILRKLDAQYRPAAIGEEPEEPAANAADSDTSIQQRLLDFLASHPPTPARIEYIESRMSQHL